MLYQIRRGSVHLLLSDHLIVIQDQHKVICALHQQIDKRRQDILERWGLWRLQVLQQ